MQSREHKPGYVFQTAHCPATTQVQTSHLRPAPPFSSSLPQVKLIVGELIEIFDQDMLVWKTGVIVRVQHDYSYSFNWSTYPDDGDISAVQEAGNPESSNSDEGHIEEQEVGNSQSSNSDAGHVCNPILIPKTPSSGDTPQLVVYLLHPPHTHTIRGDAKRQKQKHSEERLVCVNSGMEPAGLRPSLWWNPVSTQWYTVTSQGDTLVKKGEHSGTGRQPVLVQTTCSMQSHHQTCASPNVRTVGEAVLLIRCQHLLMCECSSHAFRLALLTVSSGCHNFWRSPPSPPCQSVIVSHFDSSSREFDP